MDIFRITFNTVKFPFSQHFDCSADKSNHFHVLKNNRKIGEQSKLWKALQEILSDVGENQE